MAERRCPALNCKGQPCRFTFLRRSGWCPYHDPADPILPGGLIAWREQRIRPVESPRPAEPDGSLPSLKRELDVLPKLRSWAMEFDAIDNERYTAAEFLEWLELELAPPAKPKGDFSSLVYPVLGLAALAVGG